MFFIAIKSNAKENCRLAAITWCFSDRASWIDYIVITNFDALIIIYS